MVLRTARERARAEHGFTLIELLVVILIIGILAAIAIPSFLNQKGKANDASAKELVRTAQVAAETLGNDNNGSYATISTTILQGYEATIQTSAVNNNAWLSGAVSLTGGTGYTVTATSNTGDTYQITRTAAGTITRGCANSGSHTACSNGTW